MKHFMKLKNNRALMTVMTAVLLVSSASEAMAAQGVKSVIHPSPLYNGQGSTAVNGYEADGRPVSVDAETWALLNDSVIQYDELENLVKYKSSIGQNRQVQAETGLQRSMNDLGQALGDNIGDLSDQAAQLKENGQTAAAEMVKAGIKAVQSSKAQIEMSRRTIMSTTDSRMYGGQQQLLAGVLQMFVGYQSLRELDSMYEKQVELYQSMYDLALRQQQTGLETAANASAALYDLEKAKLQYSSNAEKLRSLRVSLGTMLGYSEADAENLTIGTLPAYDPNYIATRNLQDDMNVARQHNNAYGNAYRGAMQDKNITGYTDAKIDYRETAQNLGVTMTSLYQNMQTAAAEYDAAQSGNQLAARQKDAAERQYAAGMMGLPQYKGAQVKAIAAEMSANMSAVNAASAMASYQWALKGVL